MKQLILAAALAALASAGIPTPSAHAASAPCEDKLAELRAAMTTAKLGDADLQKVKALETKGVERCNADDDKRADAFFADAMAVLGK